MELPEGILDKIRDLHQIAKAEAKRLAVEAGDAAKTERSLSELAEYATQDQPMHIVKLFEKEPRLLEKMKAQSYPSHEVLQLLFDAASREKEKILRRYPGILEEACRSAGLLLDATSRHPRYTLARGFLSLEISEKVMTARLSCYEGRLFEIPADVAPVVEAIQKEHKRLFGRRFDGNKFLRILRTQYKTSLKKDKKADGSSIPIRSITKSLARKVKGFRTDEFIIDLSKLAEEGPFDIEGRRLDLQQTKDTNKGILLYGAASRGYIGYLVFKEA